MLEKEKNIIKVNRKKLTSRQVLEKEDFSSILDKHKILTKRPNYKRKKYFFFLFLLMIILMVLYYSEKEALEQAPPKVEKTDK